MDEKECERYLSKIDRDSLTVGVEIPEYIETEDAEIPIKQIIFGSDDSSSVSDIDIMSIKRRLRSERNRLVEKIEECRIESRSEADIIVDKVSKIDRSLNAITDTTDVSIEKEMKRKERIREKKWKDFLEKVRSDE